MVSKNFWKKSTIEFTNLIKQEKEKKCVKILNTTFEVFPKVFSPIYSSDTAWFAEKIIPLVKKKKFLEIGSGSGVVACFAAIYGAASVTATDINQEAINNVISNAARHSLEITTKQGNLFDPIANDELFDIIFWNHPFFYLDEKIHEDDVISLSVYDTEYQYLREFFHKGQTHLAKGGKLILGTSNVARINLIKKFAKDENYNLCLLDTTEVPVHKNNKLKMDLRLYALTPLQSP